MSSLFFNLLSPRLSTNADMQWAVGCLVPSGNTFGDVRPATGFTSEETFAWLGLVPKNFQIFFNISGHIKYLDAYIEH
jgi:hypothetical protein